ncbi:hypothetical protein NVP1052A_75, partial [Vibrio phage 1.052.A._10N.286.46.C3]
MSKRTCHGCQHLEVSDGWRGVRTGVCTFEGGGYIVPHHWNGESNTITFWRVPNFCVNPDKIPSEKKAPRQEWVTLDAITLEELK